MIALSNWTTGKLGTVACLKTDNDAIVHKLMAMGVMPGSSVTLEQTFPSYIVKVGRTRTAMDWETAETIYIQTGES